jgi:hypothetical protein
MIRAASLVSIALGLGFGIGALVALDHRRRTDELPMTPWGFRAFAGGPFDAVPRRHFTALLWAVVGVCALDVVAGALMLTGRRLGATLGLVGSPVAFVLSVGFALPIMLIGIPLQVVLILGGRRSLRRA